MVVIIPSVSYGVTGVKVMVNAVVYAIAIYFCGVDNILSFWYFLKGALI
jgi:hypothetical protein